VRKEKTKVFKYSIPISVECIHHGERVTAGRFAYSANGSFVTTGRNREIAVWKCDDVADPPQPSIVGEMRIRNNKTYTLPSHVSHPPYPSVYRSIVVKHTYYTAQ
jgi:hypothetical protein